MREYPSFAMRRPRIYAELSNIRLNFERTGGPVEVSVDLTSASHAYNISSRSTLKLDRVIVPLTLKPITLSTNYDYRAVNTLHLVFSGTYTMSKKIPDKAQLDIRVKMSDGTSCKYRQRLRNLADAEAMPPSKSGTEGPQP